MIILFIYLLFCIHLFLLKSYIFIICLLKVFTFYSTANKGTLSVFDIESGDVIYKEAFKSKKAIYSAAFSIPDQHGMYYQNTFSFSFPPFSLMILLSLKRSVVGTGCEDNAVRVTDFIKGETTCFSTKASTVIKTSFTPQNLLLAGAVFDEKKRII